MKAITKTNQRSIRLTIIRGEYSVIISERTKYDYQQAQIDKVWLTLDELRRIAEACGLFTAPTPPPALKGTP